MPLARLRGVIEDRGDDWVIVGVGGVGLMASVPGRTASALDTGAHASLYTHLHVREDALTLYGFDSRDDLALFEQLITVSGIGPRAALGLLSALDAPQLAAAIAGGQTDVLRKVPGIGQKTAERVVLELRDKVWVPEAAAARAPAATPGSKQDQELIAALMGLGYTQAEAAAAAERAAADGAASLEDRIRAALRAFAAPKS